MPGTGLRTAAALLLAAAPAVAAAPALDPIDRVLEQSGLWRQLEELGPAILAGIEQAARSGPDAYDAERLAALRRAVTAAYSVEALQPLVRRKVGLLFPEKSAVATLDWLGSPTGRKATAAEDRAAAAEPETAQREGERLLAEAPAERREILARFSRSVRAAEATVGLLLDVQRGMLRGLAAAAPGLGLDVAARERQLDASRPALLDQFEPLVRASMAHTYRELSDADLVAYTAFAESPAGRPYHAVVAEAVHAAFEERSELLGKFVADEVARRRE
jgi:hypothetical protein